jgi:hypothetical protein
MIVTAPGSISGHELREGRDHDLLRAGGSHAISAAFVAAFGAEERPLGSMRCDRMSGKQGPGPGAFVSEAASAGYARVSVGCHHPGSRAGWG